MTNETTPATPTASGDMVSVDKRINQRHARKLLEDYCEKIEAESYANGFEDGQRRAMIDAAPVAVQALPVAGDGEEWSDAQQRTLSALDRHAQELPMTGRVVLDCATYLQLRALARPASTQQVPMDEALTKQTLSWLERIDFPSGETKALIATLRQRLKIGGAG